ncbi:hypothetical protein J3E69DRAFT_145269 [Trichoderma sp. SZMC 28015]
MRLMTASFLSECVSLFIRVIHHPVSQFVPIQDNTTLQHAFVPLAPLHKRREETRSGKQKGEANQARASKIQP